MAMYRNELMEALSYDIENDFELEAMESAADEAFDRAQELHDRIYGTGSAVESMLELFDEPAEESLSAEDSEALQQEYESACEAWAKYAKEDMKAFIGKAKAFFVKIAQALKSLAGRFQIWVAEQRATKTKGIYVTEEQYDFLRALGSGRLVKEIEDYASNAEGDSLTADAITKSKRNMSKALRRGPADKATKILTPAEIKECLKQARAVIDAGSKSLQELARLPWDSAAKPTAEQRKQIRLRKKGVSLSMQISSRSVKLLSSVMAKANKADKTNAKKTKNAGYSAAGSMPEEDLFDR